MLRPSLSRAQSSHVFIQHLKFLLWMCPDAVSLGLVLSWFFFSFAGLSSAFWGFGQSHPEDRHHSHTAVRFNSADSELSLWEIIKSNDCWKWVSQIPFLFPFDYLNIFTHERVGIFHSKNITLEDLKTRDFLEPFHWTHNSLRSKSPSSPHMPGIWEGGSPNRNPDDL